MGGFYSGSMDSFTTTGTGSFGAVTTTGTISSSGTGTNFFAGNIDFDGDTTISTVGGSDDISINPDAELNLGTGGSDEINIGRQDGTCDINMFANTSTVAARFLTSTITFGHPITASGDISSSGTITAATLDAAAVSDGLAAAIVSEIDNDEIPIAKLAEDAITIGGAGSTALGGTATAANILKGSTAVSSSAQIDSLINDTIAATIVCDIDNDDIPIAKLAEDAITIAGTSTALGGSITADTIAGQISADTISGNQINGGTIGSTTISALAGALSLGDNNITNVGDINCDSISVDAAGTGLDIVFGGNTTTNKITLTDNLADALNITEGSNSYIKFKTTDSGEEIRVSQKIALDAVHLSGSGASTGSFGRTEVSTLAVNKSELTGSYGTLHGAFNINYGNDATLSGSLANGEGYGEIMSHLLIHSGVSAGDVCYINAGVWRQADADLGAASKSMLGVALAGGQSSGLPGPVLIRGLVRLGDGHIVDSSGDEGDALYLSTTAAHVAFAVPSGNADIARIVGYCINETGDVIYFNPSSTFVEVTA